MGRSVPSKQALMRLRAKYQKDTANNQFFADEAAKSGGKQQSTQDNAQSMADLNRKYADTATKMLKGNKNDK